MPSPPSAPRRAPVWQRALLAGLSAMLVSAVAVVLYGGTRPLHRIFHGSVTQLLPPAPAGWTRVQRPVAETPEVAEAMSELLNFDEALFVDYTNGLHRVSVYVAYWSPGRMSHRLVAGHTPDVCWVGAGWRPIAASRESVELRNLDARFDDRSPNEASRTDASLGRSTPAGAAPGSAAAETRVFAKDGHREHVWFWHLVGGEPVSYGTRAQPPWHAMIGDLLKRGFDQRQEQFFIRISAPQPLDDPVLATVIEPLLAALPLGDE